MTDRDVIHKFDEFLNGVGLDVCDFLGVLGEAWIAEARRVDDPLVRALLRDAGEGARKAGMDWYVSTK